MGLVMVDLDNTLVDRAGAVRRWAEDVVHRHGGAANDVDWLVAADRDGLEPRESFAQAMLTRLGAPLTVAEVVDELRHRLVLPSDLFPGVADAIGRLRTEGHRVVCVTNGPTSGQRATIGTVGLQDSFDAIVISEDAGLRKPGPAIFRLAASLAAQSLDGAWMVGDSPTSDVAGAAAMGCRTVWIPRDRTWPVELPAPTAVVTDPAAALELVRQALAHPAPDEPDR